MIDGLDGTKTEDMLNPLDSRLPFNLSGVTNEIEKRTHGHLPIGRGIFSQIAQWFPDFDGILNDQPNNENNEVPNGVPKSD